MSATLRTHAVSSADWTLRGLIIEHNYFTYWQWQIKLDHSQSKGAMSNRIWSDAMTNPYIRNSVKLDLKCSQQVGTRVNSTVKFSWIPSVQAMIMIIAQLTCIRENHITNLITPRYPLPKRLHKNCSPESKRFTDLSIRAVYKFSREPLGDDVAD